MDVVSFIGPSRSGKTTAIVALTEHYRQRGLRIGAIKHTHHELNAENRGDTSLMRAAGANPVILAGNGEATVFDKATSRIRFATPADLLPYFEACDLVFVEGFKTETAWPRVELASNHHRTVEELAVIVDRIRRS